MRKIVLTGMAALGFLAIGATVMVHPAASRQAEAEGSGADVPVTRRTVVAATFANRAQTLLVANAARSVLV